MAEMPDDLRSELARYQQLVLDYEALDEKIDALLESYGGEADKMSEEEKRHYREMFRQRDELLNEMRMLEQTYIDPDETA